jgi:hypothetical protein
MPAPAPGAPRYLSVTETIGIRRMVVVQASINGTGNHGRIPRVLGRRADRSGGLYGF